MALLPKEKGPIFLEKAIRKLDMTALFANKTPDKVIVTMPEFESQCSSDLRAACEAMGIRTVFTNEADFSPMIDDVPLQAGTIKQKALIKVNREGTEAAAVTYMPGTTVCEGWEPEPKVIKLDRPFVYAIMHNETSIPVFIGILNSMK